jgi:AraC-like DNA-binding protein
VSFASIDQAEAELEQLGVDQRMRQAGTGAFQVNISSACMNGSELISERYDANLSLSCGLPQNSIAIIFPGKGDGTRHINGRDTEDIGTVYLPAVGELDFVFRGCFVTESVIVPKDRFESIVAAAAPESDLLKSPNVLMAGRVAQADRLRAGIVALLSQSVLSPERVADLVDAAVVYLSELRYSRTSSWLDPVSCRRIAKRAQAFVEARYMSRIPIEEICRSCGVGARTLQRAFQKYFGMTVTEYIQTTRLDRAYRALKAADPSEATVTNVAVCHGFTHLGRFSRFYKERFGESPSCTLRSF